MSAVDKAKNRAQDLAGRAKEKTGQATGDEDLVAEGRAGQAKVDLKDAAASVKDAAGKVKGTFRH